jgi:hypothetical protein
MRKTSVWILCGVMGLATPVFVAAQGTEYDPGTKEKPPEYPGGTKGYHGGTHKHAKAHSMTGEVTAVDATAKTMTVKAKSGDVNLTFDDKTVLTPKGQEIKVGDKVTVWYKTSGDTKLATKVSIHKAAPAAAKTPSS